MPLADFVDFQGRSASMLRKRGGMACLRRLPAGRMPVDVARRQGKAALCGAAPGGHARSATRAGRGRPSPRPGPAAETVSHGRLLPRTLALPRCAPPAWASRPRASRRAPARSHSPRAFERGCRAGLSPIPRSGVARFAALACHPARPYTKAGMLQGRASLGITCPRGMRQVPAEHGQRERVESAPAPVGYAPFL